MEQGIDKTCSIAIQCSFLKRTSFLPAVHLQTPQMLRNRTALLTGEKGSLNPHVSAALAFNRGHRPENIKKVTHLFPELHNSSGLLLHDSFELLSSELHDFSELLLFSELQGVSAYYSALQHSTKYCNILHPSTTYYYNPLQCTTTIYNRLQSYYNVLHCTTTYYSIFLCTTTYNNVWQRLYQKFLDANAAEQKQQSRSGFQGNFLMETAATKMERNAVTELGYLKHDFAQ